MSCSRSSSSSSCMSSTTTTSSNTRSSAHPMANSPNSIVALPSFAHSLSAFPNMTSVSNDMVHYGSLQGRTKNVSEAKLNSVLQTTRQRKDVLGPQHRSPGVTSATPLSNLSNSPSFDDESALMITRKKHKSSAVTKDGIQRA